MLQPLKSRLIIIHTIKRFFYIFAQYQCVSVKQAIKTAVKIKPKFNPIKAKFNFLTPIIAPKLNPNSSKLNLFKSDT